MDKKLSIKNIIIIVAAAIGAIATFLPWATVSFLGVSESVSGASGDGWISFAIFLAIIVLTAIKFKNELPKGFKIAVTVLGVIALIIGIFEIANINGNSFGLGSAGIGVYIVIIAGIASAILPWLPIGGKAPAKKPAKKEK